MPLLLALADAFYRTFGITEPTAQARRRAAFFLLFLLLLIPAGLATVVFLVSSAMRR